MVSDVRRKGRVPELTCSGMTSLNLNRYAGRYWRVRYSARGASVRWPDTMVRQSSRLYST